MVMSQSVIRENGRDLTQSYDKSPYTHRKIQKAMNATQNFDYTAIADHVLFESVRLHIVWWDPYIYHRTS